MAGGLVDMHIWAGDPDSVLCYTLACGRPCPHEHSLPLHVRKTPLSSRRQMRT